MTVEEFSKLCIHDRFAWIFKPKYEDWVNTHLCELAQESQTTGLLVERRGTATFYHCTPTNNVQNILANGILPSDNNNHSLSFGGDVVYAYKSLDNYSKLPKTPSERYMYLQDNNLSIFEVQYTGDYLEAIAEWDKCEEEQNTCLLYPQNITSIKLCKFTASNHTSHFSQSQIASPCVEPDIAPLYQLINISDIRAFLMSQIPVSLEVPAPIGCVGYFHNGDYMEINLTTLELNWFPVEPGNLTTSKLSMRFHQWFDKGFIVKEVISNR